MKRNRISSIFLCIVIVLFSMALFSCGGSGDDSSVTDDPVNDPIAEQSVESPTFSPPGGTYSSGQSVTLSTTTSGAAIYYTTDNDGTLTSEFGIPYTGPISVTTPVTIQAMATAPAMADSSVVSADYAIAQVYKRAHILENKPSPYPRPPGLRPFTTPRKAQHQCLT